MPLGIGKNVPTIDQQYLPDATKDAIARTPTQLKGFEGAGLNGMHLKEPVPIYLKAECEKVIEGENNTSIVLGRDRPGSRASGFGGRGATQAGSIDIVVGRMSSVGPKSDVWVDPNFISDAARIYISQKTNIDANFGLVKGGIGLVTNRSGIGIKADSVRIMSRDGGIKLITGLDGVNSHGGKMGSTNGIELIAANDDEPETHFSVDRGFFEIERLQPMVKGYNLVECLRQLGKHVDNINGILDNFISSQMRLNAALQLHTHEIVPVSGPALPSIELQASGIITAVQQIAFVKASLYTNKINLMAFNLNYLEIFGLHWICSRYNKAN